MQPAPRVGMSSFRDARNYISMIENGMLNYSSTTSAKQFFPRSLFARIHRKLLPFHILSRGGGLGGSFLPP